MGNKYWSCLIGPIPEEKVPEGADFAPRQGARAAVENLTGVATVGCTASGWVDEATAIRRGLIQPGAARSLLTFEIPPLGPDGKCSSACPLLSITPETRDYHESRRCVVKLSDWGVPGNGCPRCVVVPTERPVQGGEPA